MAWGRGAKTGLDDYLPRLRANDASLRALYVMRHRRLDAADVTALCAALAGNTALEEFGATGFALTAESAAALGRMLQANSGLRLLCVGDHTLG